MKLLIFGTHSMIRWHLAEIMDKYDIKLKDLAAKLEITNSGVSHLRKSTKMPRLDGDKLSKILVAINECLSDKPFTLPESVTLTDLIEFVPDENEAA